MKRDKNDFDSADVLNSYVNTTKPITWIVLITIILCLVGLVVWSFTAKLGYKVSGKAMVKDCVVTLTIEENKLDKINDGQVIYIGNEKGFIIDSSTMVVSNFSLEDGLYDCYIIIKEIRPIDFFKR